MQPIIQYPTQERATPTEPATPRLRTVTGDRFARKCACGCGFQIPRDSEVREVVDSVAAGRYVMRLREDGRKSTRWAS